MERELASIKWTVQTMQLRVEELEDRHRQNNVHIRGALEIDTFKQMGNKVRELLENQIGEKDKKEIQIDRIDRVLGRREKENRNKKMRHIICCTHNPRIKRTVLQKPGRNDLYVLRVLTSRFCLT